MKRRIIRKGLKAEWKARLRNMSPEDKKEWNERREKEAKSGCAKRKREREAGLPMASRSHETPRKRFVPPVVGQSREFSAWLAEFQRRTA